MIFVTVGNALQSFDRLVQVVDEMVGDGRLAADTFVQRGTSGHVPRHAASTEFLDGDAFLDAVRSAEVVITHAGVGTIIQCIRSGKTPVLVPRRLQHGEIVDDHQVQICEVLEREGRALYVRDLADLPEKVKVAAATPGSDAPPGQQLHRELRQFLTTLARANDRQPPATDTV